MTLAVIVSMLLRPMRINRKTGRLMIHPIVRATVSLALILLLRRKGAVNHSASRVKGAKYTFLPATRPKQAVRPLH